LSRFCNSAEHLLWTQPADKHHNKRGNNHRHLINTYNGEGCRVQKIVNGISTNYLYEYDKVILGLNANARMSKPLINAITDSRGVIIQISGRGADMVGTVYKAADTGKSIGNVTAVGGGSAIASFG